MGQAESPHQKAQPRGRLAGLLPSGARAEGPQENREFSVVGNGMHKAGLGDSRGELTLKFCCRDTPGVWTTHLRRTICYAHLIVSSRFTQVNFQSPKVSMPYF